MPRKPIDYSNTIIYKLCCNDPTITDVYVGHTTNWTNRKGTHKNSCNNPNYEKYNLYVYQFIREHGGWNNWSMIELEKICCVDEKDAAKHERRYFELLGATLNKEVPSRTREEWREDNAEKVKEKNKEYRENNVEKVREIQKKYREKNVEKIKKYTKEYRENNVEKEKERHKKYREENVEKVKEKNKEYRENNVEKVKEKNKEYRENNVEKEKERHKKYRENNVEKEKERHKKYRELQKQIKLETERLFDIDI
jgi:hypothetical protein